MAKGDSGKANKTPRSNIKNADIETAAVSTMGPRDFEMGYDKNENEMLSNRSGKGKVK